MEKERFAPTFDLRINNKEIPIALRSDITSVTYVSRIKGSDTISLAVSDPLLHYIDSNLFQEANLIDLLGGYISDSMFLMRGEVTEYDINFSESALPSITVMAEDISHRMQSDHKKKPKNFYKKRDVSETIKKKKKKKKRKKGGKSSRTYKNMKDSEIVKRIFRRYNLKLDVDTTSGKRSRIHKKSVNDYRFVAKLADINSCHFWIDFDISKKKWVGHFKRRATYIPNNSYTEYVYNTALPSLINFKPIVIFKKQATKVVLLSMDRVTKETKQVVKEIRNSKINSPRFDGAPVEIKHEYVSGARLTFEVFGQVVQVFTNKSFKNKKAAQAWLEKYARRNADQFIQGTAKVVGDPTLRARSLVYFEGIGKRFSGLYEVLEATHTFTATTPYFTNLKVRKYIAPVGHFIPKRIRKRRRKVVGLIDPLAQRYNVTAPQDERLMGPKPSGYRNSTTVKQPSNYLKNRINLDPSQDTQNTS